MPEINGWEFLEILEKDFPYLDCRIHILTSSIDHNVKIKAKNYIYVHSYIDKPLNKCKLPEVDLELEIYPDQAGKSSLAVE